MIFSCNVMEPFLPVLTMFAEYKISAMNSCNKTPSNQSDTRKGLPYQLQACRFSYSYFLKKLLIDLVSRCLIGLSILLVFAESHSNERISILHFFPRGNPTFASFYKYKSSNRDETKLSANY